MLLNFQDGPKVMGVLNVTPDSFSDGGRFERLDDALRQCEQMIDAGVDIIDVGGESTRPGAQAISETQESDRVMPVVEALLEHFGVALSVDTSTPSIMRAATAAGVAMINDVRAFERPGAIDAIKDPDVALCVMHMRGQPGSMQDQPSYNNVVAEVRDYLHQRVAALTGAGVALERLVLDPGFGFGKSLEHNLALLASLPVLSVENRPIMVGVSRKRMIGEMTGRPIAERDRASAITAAFAVLDGAAIIRAHDVAATRDAIQVAMALKAARQARESV